MDITANTTYKISLTEAEALEAIHNPSLIVAKLRAALQTEESKIVFVGTTKTPTDLEYFCSEVVNRIRNSL